jgi:diaminopimelate epimerase
MQFTKMHGLGNDYVYVNCFEQEISNPAELSRKISDRHFGIGSDGLILIEPSEKADVKMRIFNADGSQAEMCGNGIRCLAKYVYEHKLAQSSGVFNIPDQPTCPASITVETGAGILTVGLETDNSGKVNRVCVNMGEPILKPGDIPVNTEGENAINQPIEIDNQTYLFTAVSMGNPHAVIFCDDVKKVKLEEIGKEIENHPFFPNRVNVHFVQVVSKSELIVRTWERGSGITLACGTGACACCVAAVLTENSNRAVNAHLPGGTLELNWAQSDNCVYMTGPAEEVFTGEIDL